ncbi:magnesium transporter CorA family protein [Porcipelethomonas sp.]|uniref:magnesium transporter CorA family protein n=1 Tax=Porcipelethomonas sp. TaxID=2981675 RepID=UPI003EF4E707
MTIIALGEKLEKIEPEKLEMDDRPSVIISDFLHAQDAMKLAKIDYEGDINVSDISFCKIETHQECVAGSFCIPKLLDILGSRYKIMFFINKKHIVIIDDENFSQRIIMHIQQSKCNQGDTKERFLYNYMTQFMNRDLELLGLHEKKIMTLEESVMNGNTDDEFQNEMMPVRRELLILRSYYDELMDMGMELEQNENHIFDDMQLKYFGIIADRADRLMGRTAQLLEYSQQVRESYQAQVDSKQNKNMQFLTVISTIFFPLTLITGWYGMNFSNMPELEHGYPAIIVLSIIVVIICIIVFKKKKML